MATRAVITLVLAGCLAGCASRGWELRGPCYRTVKQELRCTNRIRVIHRFDWVRT